MGEEFRVVLIAKLSDSNNKERKSGKKILMLGQAVNEKHEKLHTSGIFKPNNHKVKLKVNEICII